MAYCLRSDESVADGLRRIAEEQLRLARGYLFTEAHLDDRVHEVRKNLKKVRAVLRLVKGDLGPAYREENRRLRDVGRRFSELRDAHAVLEVFDQFAARHRLKRRLVGVRAILQQRAADLEQRPDWPDATKAAGDELAAIQGRVEDWQIRWNAVGDLERGLQNSYQQCLRALSVVKAGRTSDQFHTLRKRTKTHLYQLRIVDGNGQAARILELKKLSDCLGRQHDLVVLLESLGSSVDVSKAVRDAVTVIGRAVRRAETVALGLADKAYGEGHLLMRFDAALHAANDGYQRV